MSVGPHITPMTWVSAKEVLPHEAHDFTPWLAANLDLLADVLGLDQLELETTEWKVDTFALDIMARGSDADGDVTVVIENQFGQTDHRHLGQILTYAAHAAAPGGRVLAVWLTEEVRPAHLAAVEFINRVVAEGAAFGMLLMRVRFAPARDGWHVHFEVDSEPNAFLSQPSPKHSDSGGSGGAGSEWNQVQGRFIEAVTAEVQPVVEAVGLRRRGAINVRQGSVAFRFPATLEISKAATARVVASATHTNVALFVERFGDPAGNWALAEVLRRTFAPLIADYGLEVTSWHGSSRNVKRDRVITRLPTGYADGDAAAVGVEAARILAAWTTMFAEHPATGLLDRAGALAEAPGEMAFGDDEDTDDEP